MMEGVKMAKKKKAAKKPAKKNPQEKMKLMYFALRKWGDKADDNLENASAIFTREGTKRERTFFGDIVFSLGKKVFAVVDILVSIGDSRVEALDFGSCSCVQLLHDCKDKRRALIGANSNEEYEAAALFLYAFPKYLWGGCKCTPLSDKRMKLIPQILFAFEVNFASMKNVKHGFIIKPDDVAGAV